LLDFQIAVYDLWLIDAIQISGLTEGKQMLRPPVAFDRFSNGLGVSFDVRIPQLGEFCAVSLSSQDGVDHGKASHPSDVADDMMDLQIHLRQRLVHGLHLLTGRRDQFVAVAQKGPYRADVLPWPKCRPQ